MDFPEKNNAVTAYLKYYDDIQYAKKEYDNYLDWIKRWLKTAIETASNNQLISSKISDFYWILVKNEKWRDIDFHFEVLWDKNKPIFDMNVLYLQAHLEGNGRQTSKEKIDALKNCFEIKDGKDVYNRSVNNPICQYTEQFSCDFSSAEAAIETIRRIIDIFNSQEFTKYAEKADKFLEMEEKNGYR